MFYNLSAPTKRRSITNLEMRIWVNAYYRLGKNRPGSGNFVRTSLSALTLHTIAVIPTMTAAMTAVFAFQLAG